MAVEARRGCGYRQVGGLYLVGPAAGEPCHRLPIPVECCPICGHGIKPARGWTWVGREVLAPGCGGSGDPVHCFICPACRPDPLLPVRCGLIWIGEEFYATPDRFLDEAVQLGISRRIAVVPRDFVLGETWVLLGHRLACTAPGIDHADAIAAGEGVSDAERLALAEIAKTPGLISVFKPIRVELILRESEATTERVADEARKCVTVVAVPDGDPDHDRSVVRQGMLGLPAPAETVEDVP